MFIRQPTLSELNIKEKNLLMACDSKIINRFKCSEGWIRGIMKNDDRKYSRPFVGG
ncbi:hypothetical protein LDI01_21020 [Lentilactobacillus diolivorans]|uniref:Uncharacterized protein n=1 Tax=Lentilactobacillus diolivorans TaxID=179838 RepID=A0ABQ0XFU1_9LACO|nr:hypothetical protein LDI01_21020 [Lentilactobacillus diolivorans]